MVTLKKRDETGAAERKQEIYYDKLIFFSIAPFIKL